MPRPWPCSRSTFFAFAREFKNRGIDHQMQPDLASMKKMFPLGLLGYPWSKLTSEQVLLFAQQAGLPLAIFRFPQTAVSTTGHIQPNDLTLQILAAAIDCESMPEGFTFRSNHEAVDTVSQACVAISLNPDRRFTIYHCCKPQLDYYELELADFGVYFPAIPYDSFKRACQARGANSPLQGRWAVLDHFGKYWFSKEKPDGTLPICDRAFREDCPHPIKWAGVLTKLKRSYQLGSGKSATLAVSRIARPAGLRPPDCAGRNTMLRTTTSLSNRPTPRGCAKTCSN